MNPDKIELEWVHASRGQIPQGAIEGGYKDVYYTEDVDMRGEDYTIAHPQETFYIARVQLAPHIVLQGYCSAQREYATVFHDNHKWRWMVYEVLCQKLNREEKQDGNTSVVKKHLEPAASDTEDTKS
jgi:hypothetical protein